MLFRSDRVYMMMEQQLLSWVVRNQKVLRADNYKKLEEEIRIGDIDPADTSTNIIKPCILPSTFVGGPCYMIQNYQDTMAICKAIGYPELFITFTCNPQWPEITRFVEDRGLRPTDRPDILARVFKMKLDQLVNDLKKENVFGQYKGRKLYFSTTYIVNHFKLFKLSR